MQTLGSIFTSTIRGIPVAAVESEARGRRITKLAELSAPGSHATRLFLHPTETTPKSGSMKAKLVFLQGVRGSQISSSSPA